MENNTKYFENEEDYAKEFFQTIKDLTAIASKMEMFDSFLSKCIIDVLELSLSKNKDYLDMLMDAETKFNKSDIDIRFFLNQCDSNCKCGNTEVQTPPVVKEEVDSIIENVKKLLGE